MWEKDMQITKSVIYGNYAEYSSNYRDNSLENWRNMSLIYTFCLSVCIMFELATS